MGKRSKMTMMMMGRILKDRRRRGVSWTRVMPMPILKSTSKSKMRCSMSTIESIIYRCFKDNTILRMKVKKQERDIAQVGKTNNNNN